MGKKHGGLSWKPPTDRKCQHWPDTYLKGGKRQKSPQGKGFQKSKPVDVRGPVSIRPCRQRDNGHGYYGGMFVTNGRVERFRLYFPNSIGNWTHQDVSRKQAMEICTSMGHDLPDWNEEVGLTDLLKIKGVGK